MIKTKAFIAFAVSCAFLTSCYPQMASDFNGLEGTWAPIKSGCGKDKSWIFKDNKAVALNKNGNKTDDSEWVVIGRFGNKQNGEIIIRPAPYLGKLVFNYNENSITLKRVVIYGKDNGRGTQLFNDFSELNSVKCNDNINSQDLGILRPRQYK